MLLQTARADRNGGFARTILGDKDEAFRLLKEYFVLNPGHRALFAKGNSWWWRPLKDDPRFAELVGHAPS